jgi:hypothetical protein
LVKAGDPVQGLRAASLARARGGWQVEVVGANLIAVAPQIEPETHLATLQHLLNLAETLHDSARRRA